MIVVLAKLIFGLLWLLAFILTCITMGFILPFIVVFGQLRMVPNDSHAW
jgi:hypothetical protein